MNNIKVDTKADLVLLLLKDGPIVGITRMQKLIFLMMKEGEFDELIDKEKYGTFKYEAWRMGPFSSELYDAINMLESMGLIKVESSDRKSLEDVIEERRVITAFSNRSADITDSEVNKIFCLTNKGAEIAEKLFNTLRGKYRNYLTRKVWNYYKQASLFDLLSYVYKKYEEYTTNSEIKNNLNLQGDYNP